VRVLTKPTSPCLGLSVMMLDMFLANLGSGAECVSLS
jgi:hypothetical protein